jgi:ribosome-binding protein aMBF1 (putative translation factor)
MIRIYKTGGGYMGIGPRIKKLRVIMDMTQAELSDRTFIVPSVICRIERGDIPIRENQMRALEKAFGLSLGELLEEEIEVRI